MGTLQIVAVKTEPKLEPTDAQYSLADLDGITDLLPIQTGQFSSPPSLPVNKQIAVNLNFLDFKVDAVSLNDLDFWDKGSERAEDRYVVASRPGHLEARWEQQHRSVTTSHQPQPSHSHFPKNPAVWRFITSIYLPHSQMEPDDISPVQNREVGERQRGQLKQLTFRFQLQR